jgi:glycosyltransferase involved in cell wall biosynthesis
MVARPTAGRFRLFARSLRGYITQTHPHRELIIVMSHVSRRDRLAAVQHVRELGRRDIRLRYVAGNPSLGRLRNIGVEMAAGNLCCQWDDDDIYHPLRIEIQLREMRRARRGGVFQQTLLHFFERPRQLYVEDWGLVPAPDNCHPGTGLWVRDPDIRYPVRGGHARKQEDLVFMMRHRERHRHLRLRAHPYLYVYTYHGTNTFDESHHRMLVSRLAPSRAVTLGIRAGLMRDLDALDLPPGRTRVMSAEGLAFVWRKRSGR